MGRSCERGLQSVVNELEAEAITEGEDCVFGAFVWGISTGKGLQGTYSLRCLCTRRRSRLHA